MMAQRGHGLYPKSAPIVGLEVSELITPTRALSLSPNILVEFDAAKISPLTAKFRLHVPI
jgi:hypothetical protein